MPITQEQLDGKKNRAVTALAVYNKVPKDDPNLGKHWHAMRNAVDEYNTMLKEFNSQGVLNDTPAANPTADPPAAEPTTTRTGCSPAPESSSTRETVSSTFPLTSEPQGEHPSHPDSIVELPPTSTQPFTKGTNHGECVQDIASNGLKIVDKRLNELEKRVDSIDNALEDSNETELREDILAQVGILITSVEKLQPLIQTTGEVHEDAEIIRQALLGDRKKGDLTETEEDDLTTPPAQLRLQTIERKVDSILKILSEQKPASISNGQIAHIESSISAAVSTASTGIAASLSSLDSSTKEVVRLLKGFPDSQLFISEALMNLACALKGVLNVKQPPATSEHERKTRADVHHLVYTAYVAVDRASTAAKLLEADKRPQIQPPSLPYTVPSHVSQQPTIASSTASQPSTSLAQVSDTKSEAPKSTFIELPEAPQSIQDESTLIQEEDKSQLGPAANTRTKRKQPHDQADGSSDNKKNKAPNSKKAK